MYFYHGINCVVAEQDGFGKERRKIMTKLLMIIVAVFFIFFCTGCATVNTLLGVAATGYGIYKTIDK